jgi:hypothetical protein
MEDLIPNKIHFIYLADLESGNYREFNKFNYASIASTRRFNQSAEINLYTNCPEYLINNKWFRLCIGYITKI